MGSSPARQKSTPEWPRYSQQMRGDLYPYLTKQLRGELTPGQQYGMGMSQDRLRSETAIARERLLRDMGRMPGVPGPERYEGLRRMQEAQIKGQAGIEAQTRIGAEQQAMANALNYSMQGAAQKSEYTGEHISTGAAMGRMAGTAALGIAGAYFGAEDVAGGVGASTQTGGGGSPGATGGGSQSGATSMPQGYSLTGNQFAQQSLQSYDPTGMGLNVK